MPATGRKRRWQPSVFAVALERTAQFAAARFLTACRPCHTGLRKSRSLKSLWRRTLGRIASRASAADSTSPANCSSRPSEARKDSSDARAAPPWRTRRDFAAAASSGAHRAAHEARSQEAPDVTVAAAGDHVRFQEPFQENHLNEREVVKESRCAG